MRVPSCVQLLKCVGLNHKLILPSSTFFGFGMIIKFPSITSQDKMITYDCTLLDIILNWIQVLLC